MPSGTQSKSVLVKHFTLILFIHRIEIFISFHLKSKIKCSSSGGMVQFRPEGL